ncbi:alpha/beta fold hydrolase [Agromyces protaetiae]|uniref:Alpha/beta fold hydrolase n=1 Tax=Agromyces protaetiae TaxID=2509455 RepID=A0A4P6FA78_9MICO|nr:alpha/beta hydrolase [Agromyces protaetiae]QAY72704.1 alpha/beta fold hydrolase [Agromyces protaetiae]
MHPVAFAARTAAASVVAAARAADRVSPALAARLALPLFRATGPRLPVRPSERAVHEGARRSTVRVRGLDLAVFEWGTGADVVLLVHGWRGRAAQFAPIVRELRAEGFRVVAFDAPANGDSPGRRTDLRDWLAAIDALQLRYGRFHAIVGHSFGALAALTAVREGITAGGVVAIAGVSRARMLVDAFGGALRLSPAATSSLASRFAGRVFGARDEASFWMRFDAAAHPLPDDMPLLLVHDASDREIPLAEAERLLAAHGDAARLLVVEGSGHSRVLANDATLDAVTAFTTGGLAALDASRGRSDRGTVDSWHRGAPV